MSKLAVLQHLDLQIDNHSLHRIQSLFYHLLKLHESCGQNFTSQDQLFKTPIVYEELCVKVDSSLEKELKKRTKTSSKWTNKELYLP